MRYASRSFLILTIVLMSSMSVMAKEALVLTYKTTGEKKNQNSTMTWYVQGDRMAIVVTPELTEQQKKAKGAPSESRVIVRTDTGKMSSVTTAQGMKHPIVIEFPMKNMSQYDSRYSGKNEFKATGETAKIAGFTAEKYLVSGNEQWYIQDHNLPYMADFQKNMGEMLENKRSKKEKAAKQDLPIGMKAIMARTVSGKTKTELESAKTQNIDQSIFEVPKDAKDSSAMFGDMFNKQVKGRTDRAVDQRKRNAERNVDRKVDDKVDETIDRGLDKVIGKGAFRKLF